MNQMEAFRLLASADRQLALHELREREHAASIGEIAQQVAARRHRIAPERISEQKVERAHVRLVHGHFPQLEEQGVVDVNWNDNEVALDDGADVDQLFDAAEEVESWPPNDLLDHPTRNR